MALEILTGVLVLITGYYAVQNHRMVLEMRRARAAQVVPSLAVTVHVLGAGHGVLRVMNVGLGPALDVDVELSLQPNGLSRRWTQPIVAPGEFHDFAPDPSEGAPNARFHLNDLTSAYSHVSLTGSCIDALGDARKVDRRVDLREFWDLTKASQHLQPHDYAKEATKRLEGIEKELKTISSELKKRLSDS